MKIAATKLFVPLALPPGAWQLYWYGRTTEAPQALQTPFLNAFLSRVDFVDGSIRQRLSGLATAEIPVSDMPALPLGTVLADGLVIPNVPLHDKTEVANVVLNFDRSNIQLANRLNFDEAGISSDGLFPQSRRTQGDDRDYQGVLLTVGGQGGEMPHVIPCSTIFQFFWARSSKWAQLMVDGRFLDYSTYIFNPTRSSLSGDGRTALIWLRQWMPDEDARFIATLAFDEYALAAGADIYRYLAQPPRMVDRRCLRALPPYQGRLPLTLMRNRARTAEGQEVWLVQSILSCGYQSSIKEVRYDRDNDGRTLDEVLQDANEKKTMVRDEKRFGGSLQTVLEGDIKLSNRPHLTGSSPTTVEIDWLKNRFPELNRINAVKLPQSGAEYENEIKARKRLKSWLYEVSTLRDAASSEELAPEANLSGELYRDCRSYEETDSVVKGDVFKLAQALLSCDGKPRDIDGKTWVIGVKPIIAGAAAFSPPFFLVPASKDGMRWAWRYRDREKKFRKRAVCLRIDFVEQMDQGKQGKGLVRYLLDFEERQGQNQNRMLLFRNAQDVAFKNEVVKVRSIVNVIAEKKTTNVSPSSLPGVIYRLRKHRSGDLSNFWLDLLKTNPGMSS